MSFTHDFTSMHFTRWEKKLAPLRGLPRARALELGCYEGRATVWLLENVFTSPTARYTVVDTFSGGEGHDGDLVYDGVFDRFRENTQPHCDRLRVLRGSTAERGSDMPSSYYDFVYVDASHTASDVLADCVLAHRVLKPGGLCICDDYEWPGHPGNGPKEGIDAFLKVYAPKIRDVEIGYQCDWVKA